MSARSRARPWWRDPLPPFDSGPDGIETRIALWGPSAVADLIYEWDPLGRVRLYLDFKCSVPGHNVVGYLTDI
jgi:hypothetical protein